MPLPDLQKYPLETQVALLASAYSDLSTTVTAMDGKLDAQIAESNRKKGMSAIFDKIFNIVISILAGGGAGIAIGSAANHAATTIVNTH